MKQKIGITSILVLIVLMISFWLYYDAKVNEIVLSETYISKPHNDPFFPDEKKVVVINMVNDYVLLESAKPYVKYENFSMKVAYFKNDFMKMENRKISVKKIFLELYLKYMKWRYPLF